MFRSMGLLLPMGAHAPSIEIGLVLDDPKGFESAGRSFVPETPNFMQHM